MRKLSDALFSEPTCEKVDDKTMLTRVITTISVVIFCLVAMSLTAFAYYSCSVSSRACLIRAAHFATKVSLTVTDENGEMVDVIPATADNQTHTVFLEAGKLYTVKVAPGEESDAKTGFVVITAKGNDEIYHTRQLGADAHAPNGETPNLTFKLTVTDSTEVSFLAHWGTSSYYDDYVNQGINPEFYVLQDEEIILIVNGITEFAVNTHVENTQENEQAPAQLTDTPDEDTQTSPSDLSATEAEQTTTAEPDLSATVPSVSETPDTSSEQTPTENGSVG